MAELLASRLLALYLRLYSSIYPDKLTHVAPYGTCKKGSDALSWLGASRSCLEHDGIERCWYMYSPPSALESSESDGPVPLHIHLHGAGGCASLPSAGWGTQARKNGFVVVWPQGTSSSLSFIPDLPFGLSDFLSDLIFGELATWNDGSGLFGAEEAGVDDIGFLQKMIPDVLASNPLLLDPSRVYLSGHSNGAVMTQRFVLQTNGLIAGAVAMSGAAMPSDSEWSPGGEPIIEYEATPMMLISGTLDGVVPFSERRGPLAGAIASLEGWAFINGCPDPVNVVVSGQDYTEYTQYTYTGCDNAVEVALIKLKAGHHTFTKGVEPFQISLYNVIADCPFRGPPFFYEPDCQLEKLDTTQLAWDFVKRFQLLGK